MKLAANNLATHEWQCLIDLDVVFKKHGVSYQVNSACGFFTAILSSKALVATRDWVKIFIDASTAGDIDSINELMQALLVVYNKIALELYEDKYSPSLLKKKKIIAWHKATEECVMDWCFGYCRGSALCESDWTMEQYEESMPMALLGGVIDIDPSDPPTNEELTDFAMMIPALAQSVYNMGFNAREDDLDDLPNTPKIGRNDQCSCGSGKKYKKCCLAEEESTIIH